MYRIGVIVNETEFKNEEMVKMARMVMLDEVGHDMKHRATVFKDNLELLYSIHILDNLNINVKWRVLSLRLFGS